MACKNVLIVDDDQAIRQMLQDVLEIQGYKTLTANNGKEGIEKLKPPAELPCVIVLDLMMPGMNGWEFLDHQRSNPNLARIPVIVCSAYRESAKSVHAHAVVEKPIKLDQLLGAVKALCA
jgi:CheY-like chemotaxis protein